MFILTWHSLASKRYWKIGVNGFYIAPYIQVKTKSDKKCKNKETTLIESKKAGSKPSGGSKVFLRLFPEKWKRVWENSDASKTSKNYQNAAQRDYNTRDGSSYSLRIAAFIGQPENVKFNQEMAFAW